MTRAAPVLAALAASVLLLLLVLRGVVVRTDMAEFLQAGQTQAARLVMQEARTGTATGLILLGLDGAPPAELARISLAMAATLRGTGLFSLVAGGQDGLDPAIGETLFVRRYLLAQADFGADALRTGMQGLLRRWAGGSTVRVVDGAWFERDRDRALLLARTRAGGMDMPAQEAATAAIGVPIVLSVAAAAAGIQAGFGSVHGVALGFGTTMLGVSVDYPVLMIGHRKRNEPAADTRARIGRAFVLAVMTAILGLAAIVFSGFPGLLQLGVFSAVGLASAALATWFVLPRLIVAARALVGLGAGAAGGGRAAGGRRAALGGRPREPQPGPGSVARPGCGVARRVGRAGRRANPAGARRGCGGGAAPPGGIAACARPVAGGGRAGRHRVRRPAAAQRRDAARAGGCTAGPDGAGGAGRAGGGRPAVPRRGVRAVRRSGRGFPHPGAPTPADLAGTPIAARLDPLLHAEDGGWAGPVVLSGVRDPAQLRGAFAGQDGVTYVDVRAELGGILSSYTARAWRWLGWSALAVLLVLATGLRDAGRVVRVLAAVTAALLVVVVALSAGGLRLSLIHLVALQLVAGVGLDYALFFARPLLDAEKRARTLRTLLTCNHMALLTFGLLATCQTPILRDFGITVAVGAVLAMGSAFLIAGQPPPGTA